MSHVPRSLFQPFAIRNLSLRNRFVLPGMQRGWNANFAPLPKAGDFLGRCAEGGASLIISEGVAVDHPSATWQSKAACINEATAEVWEGTIERVHRAGAAMFIQLWHEGAIRLENRGGPDPSYPSLSPSGLTQRDKPNGRAATPSDLAELKDAYVRGALLAEQIGADGVEVSCAHGYLLDQFLWSETNVRTDAYGGPDAAARARFIAEIIREIRAATGEDFVISLRFSQWKEVDYEARIVESPEELGRLLDVLRGAGVDVFHVSTRRFRAPEWPSSDLGLAGWTRSLTDAPVIANGSVGLTLDVMKTFFTTEGIDQDFGDNLRELERRFLNSEFDMVSVGRSHIGDSEWVSKVASARFDEIRPFTRALLADLVEGWDTGVIGDAHDMDGAVLEREHASVTG